MQNPRELIAVNIKKWLDSQGIAVEFEVSLSQNPDFGDFASNIALIASKKIENSNPKMLAVEIISYLQENPEIKDIFEKIESAGPGFINFYLSKKWLFQELKEVVQKEKAYGTSNKRNAQKIIVEYSSPNIAKPFTIGHLRSTIIGNAVANLLEAEGARIARDNHIGDWGTQFGKQIYAIKAWGNEEKIDQAENPVKELVALYVKFHEEAEKDAALDDEARAWFVKLEKGDSEAKRLWQKCIDWSFKEFDRLYQLLGVSFTENNGMGYGESFFEDKMQVVIEELREKKLLKESEGAELVFFPEEKYPPLMILKKDGSTLYATRDLATDKFRLAQHGNDVIIINEVGIEQSLYFNQLYETEKLLGWVKPGQRIHIKHGHFRFSEGKMSTRKGNVIWLEDVLEEAKKRAFALSEQKTEFEGNEAVTSSLKVSSSAQKHNPGAATRINNSETIAISAMKWNDLKRSSEQDVTFDWDDVLNMHGNSGPYLQYTYVRTQSVLQKAVQAVHEIPQGDHYEKEELELLRFVTQYPYVVEISAQDFAPNLLCNYLFELSQKYNLFYQKCKIIGGENEAYRLMLTKAVGVVLKNGLTILGIETVEKM